MLNEPPKNEDSVQGLGQSMLGSISYKRNIGKNTKLLFLKKEEITKKQEICQGVWLGESMIGNRLGQVIQFKKMQALFLLLRNLKFWLNTVVSTKFVSVEMPRTFDEMAKHFFKMQKF